MLRLGVQTCIKHCFQQQRLALVERNSSLLQSTGLPDLQFSRNTNFFSRRPAEKLWEAITTVSNAGKRRGREKAVKKRAVKNLNKGQVMGVGPSNIVWPGLTTQVLQGREIVKQHKLPPDPERQAQILQLRDMMASRKKNKIHPLERGWSGHKWPGRSIGKPDPVGEETFENFDTRVLEYKIVATMTAKDGRKRRMATYVITGNNNGVIGLSIGRGATGKEALTLAKNRAAQKLIRVPVCDGHTVHHDFYSEFGHTRLFVQKKPKGHGLICHRAIKTCCEIIGIKDLYAKVEGSTTLQCIVKAFIVGLIQQKTFDEIAQEKKLHVVEVENGISTIPKVLASPEECLSPEKAKEDPILDFQQYILDGKVLYEKKKRVPFYQRLPGWTRYIKKNMYRRNFDQVRIELMREHGLPEYGHSYARSYLSDKYPECRMGYRKPKADDSA